jgi:hypothetical protein
MTESVKILNERLCSKSRFSDLSPFACGVYFQNATTFATLKNATHVPRIQVMIRDLSAFHSPLSDSKEGRISGLLSNAQVERFVVDSFVTGIDVLNAGEVELLREELDQIINGEYARSPL